MDEVASAAIADVESAEALGTLVLEADIVGAALEAAVELVAGVVPFDDAELSTSAIAA